MFLSNNRQDGWHVISPVHNKLVPYTEDIEYYEKSINDWRLGLFDGSLFSTIHSVVSVLIPYLLLVQHKIVGFLQSSKIKSWDLIYSVNGTYSFNHNGSHSDYPIATIKGLVINYDDKNYIFRLDSLSQVDASFNFDCSEGIDVDSFILYSSLKDDVDSYIEEQNKALSEEDSPVAAMMTVADRESYLARPARGRRTATEDKVADAGRRARATAKLLDTMSFALRHQLMTKRDKLDSFESFIRWCINRYLDSSDKVDYALSYGAHDDLYKLVFDTYPKYLKEPEKYKLK